MANDWLRSSTPRDDEHGLDINSRLAYFIVAEEGLVVSVRRSSTVARVAEGTGLRLCPDGE